MKRWILILAVLAFFPLPAWARWEGPWDNKPAETLASLDNKALFNEAFDVCVQRASFASTAEEGRSDPVVRAATDYLVLIEGYARESNGGTLPDWMRDISFAWTTKECQRVFRDFVGGGDMCTNPASNTAPRPKAKRRPKPKAAAPAAPTPMPEITDELPPWLVPRKQ